MKTRVFAMSMLTLSLSCSLATGLPVGDAVDGATWTDSAPVSPDSGEGTTVVAQSLPHTIDECRACEGDWGMHGLSDAISQTESCDCRTKDGGKRCTDGIDCQGMCVANADNPEFDVVDIGPPARGFLVGRCSDFVTVFGCNPLIDAGARDLGPVSVTEPPPVLCVD
jgi:hypothetical protein